MKSEPGFDVIVYEIATGRVDAIVGTSLRREGKYNSAESRLDTILGRLNDRFNADIVAAGAYKVGDIMLPFKS